jgi:predicted nucleic acid-binding protein
MNGDKYLLDTNIVLYILNGEEDLISFLNNQSIYISIITEIELLSFHSLSRQELHKIKNLIDELIVIPLDDKVKDAAIAARQKHKLKLPDSIIAGTTIAYDIPLISADKQFKAISELQLLIYDPKA